MSTGPDLATQARKVPTRVLLPLATYGSAASTHLARRCLRHSWCDGTIVLVGLHTPAGRRFVLSRVTRFLASQQINLRADQLRFNLLDLSVNLRDVTIASPRASEDPPFAVISRVDADVRFLDPVRGRYVVESVALDGVNVHCVVHADGSDNVPRPPRDPDAPSKPLDDLIASLAVSNATVRYENRAQQIDATLPVHTMLVQGNRLTDRHAVSLVATDGVARARGRRARLDRLSATVDLGDDDLRMADAILDAERSHAELRGTVASFSNPQLDLRLRATIDVTRAAAAAAISDAPGGDVTVEASVGGGATAPEVDARIDGRELSFRTLAGTSLDAHVIYSGSRRQLTANQLRLRAPWGSATGKGVVSMADDNPSGLQRSPGARAAGDRAGTAAGSVGARPVAAQPLRHRGVLDGGHHARAPGGIHQWESGCRTGKRKNPARARERRRFYFSIGQAF